MSFILNPYYFAPAGGGGGPAEWTPADITTALWLDAADASVITTDGSGNVEEWLDKSGNARHATQATAGDRPPYDSVNKAVTANADRKNLYGVDAFAGIADGSINEYTMFAVCTPDKAVSVRPQTGTGTDFFGNRTNTNCFFRVDADTGLTSSPVAPIFGVADNSIHMTETRNSLAPFNISRGHSVGKNPLLVMYERKTDRSLRSGINGVYAAGAAGGVTNLSWTGGVETGDYRVPAEYTSTAPYNGAVHEVVLIHNGALDDATIKRIEGYLAHKWGLEANLPVGHPYKNAAPTTEWTPADATTALWLDAADATTITESGGAVSAWADKSGNARHATQATGANQPAVVSSALNSLDVLSFDGTNDIFSLASPITGTAVSVFFVVNKPTVSSGYRTMLRLDQHQSLSRLSTAGNVWGCWVGAEASSGQALDADYSVLSVVQRAINDVDLVTDGVLVNSTVGSSFASSPTNYVGGSSPGTQNHPGNIAEVVVVATAVDTATRQRIEGYLAHKWGLEANLPVDHPYKDAPPTI